MADIDINEAKANSYNYSLIIKNRYYNDKRTKVEKETVKVFMMILKQMIQARTNLCYLASFDDKEASILIPIDILDNKDVKSFRELLKKKISSLKTYLEKDIDWDGFNNNFKVVISALSLYKFDYSRMLYISSSAFKNKLDINLKEPKLKKMSIKTHRFGDDLITEVYNPYLSTSLFDLDLSAPYDEMSIVYNALHVYEHIMCIPFAQVDDVKNERIRYSNGFTSSIGICHAFAFCDNEETYSKYLKSELKWFYESREDKFWTENKKAIDNQITRTISETKDEVTFVSFARSPGCAYSFDYDVKLFKYWSNRPLNCLLVHPYTDFEITKYVSALSKRYPIKKLKAPDAPKLKYFPLAAVMITNKVHSTTEKLTEKQVTDRLTAYFEKGEICDGIIGYDVAHHELNSKNQYFETPTFAYIPMCTITQSIRVLPEKLAQQVIVFMFNRSLGNIDEWIDEAGDSKEGF